MGLEREVGAKNAVPALLMVGGQDDLMASNLHAFEDLGAKKKTAPGIACAAHFAVREKPRRVLHRASLGWLRGTKRNGKNTGMFRADETGRIAPPAGP